MSYAVFVLNSQPAALTRGMRAGLPIDPSHAWVSLYNQIPGLGFLIPAADLPAGIGGVKQDSLYTKQAQAAPIAFALGADGSSTPMNLPASTVYDTTIVVWHRATSDTAHAAISRHNTRLSDGGNATVSVATGMYALAIDADKRLRQVMGSMETMTTSTSANPNVVPVPRKSTVAHSLVRIP
jgi:hypothetical protein